MKKAIIALVSTLCIIAAAIGALFVWEHQSKLALESQAEDFLDARDTDATSIDVHGRPYILYAMRDSADLTYVDLALQAGTNKDQLLVHRLSDSHADRLTRFVTFDHPDGEVEPIERADGSFTDSAEVNGSRVTFSADVADDRLQVFADGSSTGQIEMKQDVTVKGTAVTNAGVVVELEYDSPDCPAAA
ncbi:hypothetical protein [Brevibacterium sp. FME37]|uniref:hypothetical protein n=1 Tax=Brevibacterium sp. FME37 TaxID=2742607 RepID=UPI00186793B5|nr:hypothetical protein [Brevibacterium sp. FME37]